MLLNRKIHNVIVLGGEHSAHAICSRVPAHRLLRHVYRSREYGATRAAQVNALAWLAEPVHGGLAIDLRDIGVCNDLIDCLP